MFLLSLLVTRLMLRPIVGKVLIIMVAIAELAIMACMLTVILLVQPTLHLAAGELNRVDFKTRQDRDIFAQHQV